MSRIDQIMQEAKVLAFDNGLSAVARGAGINEDTLKRMLGDAPPKAIQNIKALDEYVSSQRQSPPAP